MSHGKAKLTPAGRLLLVERIERDGWPPAHAASMAGVSRATAYKWLRRWRSEGVAGLRDRSSRPHTMPTRTSAELEARVCALRRELRRGPHLLAGRLAMAPSTVHAVTDNAKNYVLSRAFQAALGERSHKRIRPHRPQTNGKAERFNRTLLQEWAYARVFDSNAERAATLDDWLHDYNWQRAHSALDNNPPISRLRSTT